MSSSTQPTQGPQPTPPAEDLPGFIGWLFEGVAHGDGGFPLEWYLDRSEDRNG